MHITPLGPRPAPPPPSGLGPARRRVLETLARFPAGATIAELVAELGGHPNSIRLHLDALAATEDGSGPLVDTSTAPPVGRGRPGTVYRATAAGRSVPSADPTAQDYQGLVTAFAEHLAAQDDDPSTPARSIGREWGSRLAPTRLDRPGTIELLGRLGFTPVPERETSLVRLTTCPLLDVATAHPDVVCQVHIGLVEGALRSSDEDRVTLEPFAEPGACRLRIETR